jgi:copper transport protein
MKRVLAVLALLFVAATAFAPTAGAHAALESTTPAAGDILDAAPREITLQFSEPVHVDDDGVRIFDASGSRLDTGDPATDGSTIAVPVSGLDVGGYVVTWKVVSEDGHPIGGGFTFRVGDDAAAVDPGVVRGLLEGQTSPREVGVAHGFVRFLVFGGILLLVGGAAFVAALWPAGADRRIVRRLLWWAWGAVLACTLLGLGLQSVELAGGGLADITNSSNLAEVLDTDVGKVWLLRALALVPVAWLLGQLRSAGKTWWRIDAAVFGLVLVATPAFSGHADTGRWTLLAKVFDIAHVGSAAVWLGGLTILFFGVLRTDVPDARSITERWSPVAFGAVVVVSLTGVGQAIRQVTTLDALETSYGRLLAVKIVLVIALIGVASLTRSALQGRLTFGDPDAVLPAGPGAMTSGESDDISILRKLVGAEVAIALVVVAVTALLVDANPGYAVGTVAGPFDETKVVDDVLVNVVAVPGSVGPTDIHVYVDNPSGGLEPPVDVTGTLALPGADIQGIDVEFVTAGPSHWSANDIEIPIAGDWELTLQVLLTDVDQVTATYTIPIGGSQ